MSRTDKKGEPIPLTIPVVDEDSIRVVFLAIAKTMSRFASLRPGNHTNDGAGPFGTPRVIRRYGTCVLIGEGVGCRFEKY